jgi:hypothetical protein
MVLGSGGDGGGALAGAYVIGAAGGGAFWGGLIGLTLHSRPMVYQGDAPTVRTVPFVTPGRAGVMVSASF